MLHLNENIEEQHAPLFQQFNWIDKVTWVDKATNELKVTNVKFIPINIKWESKYKSDFV